MTTPDLDFPLPYTFGIFASTRYWWHISKKNRGTWGSAYYQHRLSRGEYQIMISTTWPDSIRMRIRQDGREDEVVDMVKEGPPRTPRTGVAMISVVADSARLEFPPISLISQETVSAGGTAVVTIFPQISFTP